MVAAVDENPVRRRSVALTISIVLHGLILLFFLLYKIITPIPPFPPNEGGGSGLELALGFSELGQGNNNADKPTSTPAPPVVNTPAPQPESAVLTSDADEDAPVIQPKTPDKPKTTKDKTKPDKPKKPTKEQQEQAFKDKMSNLWNATGTGSSGKGASDTPGNAGGATGSPTGNGIGNGTGSYRGDGWSVDLAGRSIRVKPTIDERPNVGGKVVMDIWVGPDGKVNRVNQNTSKSTTLNHTLVSIARRAALESVFYPDPKAHEDQHGTMTFIFTLQ